VTEYFSQDFIESLKLIYRCPIQVIILFTADIKSRLLSKIASERIAYGVPQSKVAASAQIDGCERHIASIYRHQNLPKSILGRPIILNG
jgi:hypothetical protein